jgi:pimeloyl-ACP methyl ester carboxylesterase
MLIPRRTVERRASRLVPSFSDDGRWAGADAPEPQLREQVAVLTQIRVERARAGAMAMNHARAGTGTPLVLLRGWPEFLAGMEAADGPAGGHFDLIAPEWRGFGDSTSPTGLRVRWG